MRILAKSLAASAVFALVIGSGSAAVASKAIPKQDDKAIPVKAIPKTAIPKTAIPKISARAIPMGAIPKGAIPKGQAIP